MNQSRSIVKQASILAIAGILVRIIGVLYRSPLTHLIGDEGIGYYSSAYEIYTLILLISSYSIPTAISKLLSEKLVLKQYNNVQKILHCAFIYICAIGGGTAIVTFFIAPYIVPENAVIALKVLCPTIFLSGLLGVFRGYFQAHQRTVYTSVSQIIEQIFNAIVSVLAAYLFIQPYINTPGSALASYGAAGSALGTGIGVLAGLIYMALLYIKHKNDKINDMDELTQCDDHVDSYKSIFQMILSIVTPIIIATCIYNSVTTFEMYIYYWIKGDGIQQSTLWGLYIGKYAVLRNVPVALASAMSTAAIPAIASSWSIHNYQQTKENIKSAIRVTMLILIPASVGMSVLSYPIIGIIFPQQSTIKITSTLLMFGSPSIVFFGLSTLTNGILQALGKVNKPLKNASIALIWHCILVIGLLSFTNLDLYAILFANCFYAIHVCYLNHKTLTRLVHYHQGFKKTYLLPTLASLIMGICVALCYYGLFFITKQVFIPLIISIIIGIVVYFIIILYFYSNNPEELSAIPYAGKIINKLYKH